MVIEHIDHETGQLLKTRERLSKLRKFFVSKSADSLDDQLAELNAKSGQKVHFWANHFFQAGLDQNCIRCDLTVLNWNQTAIDFYKRFGALDMTQAEGWHTFSMKKEDMLKFVSM